MIIPRGAGLSSRVTVFSDSRVVKILRLDADGWDLLRARCLQGWRLSHFVVARRLFDRLGLSFFPSSDFGQHVGCSIGLAEHLIRLVTIDELFGIKIEVELPAGAVGDFAEVH